MWIFTTIKNNCEADPSRNLTTARLLNEVNARIKEAEPMGNLDEESSEETEDSTHSDIEEVVDISLSTVHLQRLEKEVDELRMNLVDLYEKVERLEAEAALSPNELKVDEEQIDHEEVENAEFELESAAQEKRIETEKEMIE